MKQIVTVSALAILFSALLTGTALAKAQTTCPIMGGKINKEVYADHDGKRVYFCCAGCIEPFKKNPEKHIKKLEGDGVVLDKTPVASKKTGHEGHNH